MRPFPTRAVAAGALVALVATACSSPDPGAYTPGRRAGATPDASTPSPGPVTSAGTPPAATTSTPDPAPPVVGVPDAGGDASSAPAAARCIVCVHAGGAAYTAANGRVYVADTGSNGGDVFASTNPIANTNDAPLFQTERYGKAFAYALPVPNGAYTLNLHFAEVYWTAAGQRVFNVDVQGQRVLDNFDIVQTGGAANSALTKTFAVTVTNGSLDLAFTTVTDAAKISAIELLPASL